MEGGRFLDDLAHRVLHDLYHPFERDEELASCFAEVARRLTGARWAQVVLRHAERPGPLNVWIGDASGTHRAGGEAGKRDEARYPIRYQSRRLGYIALPGRCPAQGLPELAQTLAYHLMRLRATRRALEHHGYKVALVGPSPALAAVDRFLEGASTSSLPALLMGAVGSEVERFGMALHVLGGRAKRPFLQVHCGTLNGSDTTGRWLDLCQRADGGTLLLAHLEDLEKRSQHRLLQLLEVGVGAWLESHHRPPAKVRIVASAATDAVDGEVGKTLDDRLLAAIAVLRVEVEPLHRRRQDVRALFEHFLHQYHSCKREAEVSEEVLAACVGYDWPGDRLELARTVARLVAFAGTARVLEAKHLRELADGPWKGFPLGSSPDPDHPPADTVAARLLLRCGQAHPALRVAIRFIVSHDTEKIKLSQVATAAHVSDSYLSHLFQQEMGTTFTSLLAFIRVERAKQLLQRDPWEHIIAVASRAGFTSLRQLERTFKKYAGCTASTYRRQLRRGREITHS